MAIITSDTFTGLGLDVTISGRTLDNGLGGSATKTWAYYNGASNNLRGDGAGRLYSNGNQAFVLVSVAGAKKFRFKFDPAGSTSSIGLLIGAADTVYLSGGVQVGFGYSHTFLSIHEITGGVPVEKTGVNTTAPAAVFYLEAEVSGNAVTARVLNEDTSVRNTVSYTFAANPFDGDYWGFGFGGSGATGYFDDPLVDDGVAGDVTAPTLTSATATATSATTATGGVTTDEAGPAWAVLTTSSTTPSAAQIKAGQDHTGAAASASDTATLAVGANPGVFDFTGLTSGGTYWLHVVQDDTATPANTSTPITSASSFTTPAPDTTAPTFTGSITVGAKTSSTIALTLPTATDNVAVTGYEYRVDAGAWVDNGNSTAVSITGLAALTSYTIDARAYDAAANASTTLSVTTSTYRAGGLGSTILLTTGPISGNPAGILYAQVATDGSDDAKWFSYVITTPPATGTLEIDAVGTYTFNGPSPESLVFQLEVDGANFGSPITVTLYDVTPELAGEADAIDIVDAGGSALFSYTLGGVADAVDIVDVGGDIFYGYTLGGVADVIELVDVGGDLEITAWTTYGTRILAPSISLGSDSIKTVEQLRQDRRIYAVDFDAKYLIALGDTATVLKAVASDPGISVSTEVPVGGALTSGTVKLMVHSASAAGNYRVWVQITTSAGEDVTAVFTVQVEDL